MDKKLFAERVKIHRQMCGLKQSELGEIIGIAQFTVSYIERGKALTSIETLYKMARCFKVTVDYLLGLSDDPHKTEIILTA